MCNLRVPCVPQMSIKSCPELRAYTLSSSAFTDRYRLRGDVDTGESVWLVDEGHETMTMSLTLVSRAGSRE